VVEPVACVDEVDWLAGVDVARESRLDRVNVGELARGGIRADRVDHRGRDVNSNDVLAVARRRNGEGAGPGTKVDKRAFRPESVPAQHGELLVRINIRLALVTGDVGGFDVFGSGQRKLVEQRHTSTISLGRGWRARAKPGAGRYTAVCWRTQRDS